MRKQNESSNHTEQNSSQLRQQVETRLGELRDILVELRNKQDTETQERRLLEQQLQLKYVLVVIVTGIVSSMYR